LSGGRSSARAGTTATAANTATASVSLILILRRHAHLHDDLHTSRGPEAAGEPLIRRRDTCLEAVDCSSASGIGSESPWRLYRTASAVHDALPRSAEPRRSPRRSRRMIGGVDRSPSRPQLQLGLGSPPAADRGLDQRTASRQPDASASPDQGLDRQLDGDRRPSFRGARPPACT
jgi:hypothetical protein